MAKLSCLYVDLTKSDNDIEIRNHHDDMEHELATLKSIESIDPAPNRHSVGLFEYLAVLW